MPASAADIALGAGSLAVVRVGFGSPSRRFECQADASAAQHQAGHSPTVNGCVAVNPQRS